MNMKIGMLTSGGDCQGLNAALRGVAKTLYNEMGKGVTLYGIRDGYRGLIEGDYHEMKPDDFSDILTLGGTILGEKDGDIYLIVPVSHAAGDYALVKYSPETK